MSRSSAVLLALFAISAELPAQTAPPVDGIYWDPGKGGRGYAVETQNDSMFVAIFDYDADSSPSFYTIQAQWDPVRRRARNAELLQVTSGPWIGGAYSPPGEIVSRGPVVLEFPSFTTARFTYNGQTSNLQRFLFGYGPQANSLMQGLWHATYGADLTFGDFVVITGDCTVSSCSDLSEPFVGHLGSSTSRVIVGSRLSDGSVLMLADSSTSYYSLYAFELRVNQWVGWEATFRKTETTFPTSGLLMVADRMFGPAFSDSLKTEKAGGDPRTFDGMDALKAGSAAVPLGSTGAGKSLAADERNVRATFPALVTALQAMR